MCDFLACGTNHLFRVYSCIYANVFTRFAFLRVVQSSCYMRMFVHVCIYMYACFVWLLVAQSQATCLVRAQKNRFVCSRNHLTYRHDWPFLGAQNKLTCISTVWLISSVFVLADRVSSQTISKKPATMQLEVTACICTCIYICSCYVSAIMQLVVCSCRCECVYVCNFCMCNMYVIVYNSPLL